MPWLFLTYPLLAHLATYWRSQELAAVALAVFIIVPLSPALKQRRLWAWLVAVGTIAGLYWCAHGGWARALMYVPPVLIPLAVVIPFARSLRAGEVPLVTRIATAIRGSLPAELADYTRHVTQLWTGLLLAQAVGSIALALFASPALWSLMTNCVFYLLMGALFLLEYLLRRWRFRHLPHEGFFTMIHAIATTRMY